VRQRIACLGCLLAAPFLAHAQVSGTCTNATLTGTYSLTLAGRGVTAAVAITKVFEGVGTITFDGVSAVTATLTTSTNQAAGVTQTLAGTYTIPSNCVGTLNFTSGDTASYTLIPYNKSNDFIMTGQDANYEFTGSGGPQPVSCLTSTLSGVYAFSGNGFSLNAGAIMGVNYFSGLLEFDGAGTLTGNFSLSNNGMAIAETISGQYSVSSSCVGTATVKDSNGVGYTLSYALTTADGANATVVGATPQELFTGTIHAAFTNPGLSVANAAGISGGTPAGSLFSIYGSGFSTNNGQAVTLKWPTTLANASVTVNGELAPLYYVSPTQINAEMPLDVAPGVVTVIVKNGSTPSNSVAVTVPSTAVPGVFIYGANRAVAQNLPSYTLNASGAAGSAPAGSYIVVYFTGGGPVQGQSSLVTGQATPSGLFPLVQTNVTATVGGIASPNIPYIGLTSGLIGVYQADIQIPPTIAAGNHNLIITIGGVASPATTISTN
jgi:uncharacterized protein (TIGR03437 family)